MYQYVFAYHIVFLLTTIISVVLNLLYFADMYKIYFSFWFNKNRDLAAALNPTEIMKTHPASVRLHQQKTSCMCEANEEY